MKQYNAIKAKYPDALLLFRVGDFYETFGSDAVRASKILGIVLTHRKNGAAAEMELAGFPHHSLDTYLPKLVRAGCRVAICDQLEDPKTTKKIVKRGVTELVTPGVVYNDNVLEQKSNNFLACLFHHKDLYGAAFLDISTGEFLVAQGNSNYVRRLVQSFKPSEILYVKNQLNHITETFGEKHFYFKLEDWIFTETFAREILLGHFETNSLKGFGIETLELATIAAGAALHYIKETKNTQLGHIKAISRINESDYVWLDPFTVKNLELISGANEGAVSLSDILDKTITPMGARLLKRWILMPLKKIEPIHDRLNAVEFLLKNPDTTKQITTLLNNIGDLERLAAKLAAGRILPREAFQIQHILLVIEPLKTLLTQLGCEPLKLIADKLNACPVMQQKISTCLSPDCTNSIGKGKTIADGYNAELDELRMLSSNGKEYLLGMQKRETELTGISSLKIAYNNVFGYYLEVRNTHKDKVPDTWIRKQTLVNAERYITQELKEYESKILGAEEKIFQLETEIFQTLLHQLQTYNEALLQNAALLAQIDCLHNFAHVAEQNNYVKPQVNLSYCINITDGRHPVIEKKLPVGESYVTNNVYLDNEKQQIIVITGPNMSGKSALLRQTALIVLMAQIGCFIPAKSAEIGLIDRIFTRVGASDNLSTGESTFMVEMNETASILNNLSERSLILLDEIGRGTSTYDGISIAWAIAEYLHEIPKLKPKTLFATHYHELNEMAKQFNRIKNYNVSVKEFQNKVLFLRKLVPGGSEHSFGIHVAKMAGMPKTILNRSNEILKQLEAQKAGNTKLTVEPKTATQEQMQLSFIQLADPVLEQIREELENLDINNLTPLEALMKLNEIKKITGIKS
ncbi:MAG: DNA mismatch repair protein MutS [Luteibaculaceae bacterium]